MDGLRFSSVPGPQRLDELLHSQYYNRSDRERDGNDSAREVSDDDREHDAQNFCELRFHDCLSAECSADFREPVANLVAHRWSSWCSRQVSGQAARYAVASARLFLCR
jgi:hypothetical protein